MTAPLAHPSWCDVAGSCTAYSTDPDATLLHRSRPIFPVTRQDETVAMYLSQDPTWDEVDVELVVYPPAPDVPPHLVEDIYTELSFALGEADAIRHAMGSLVKAARNLGGTE